MLRSRRTDFSACFPSGGNIEVGNEAFSYANKRIAWPSVKLIDRCTIDQPRKSSSTNPKYIANG